MSITNKWNGKFLKPHKYHVSFGFCKNVENFHDKSEWNAIITNCLGGSSGSCWLSAKVTESEWKRNCDFLIAYSGDNEVCTRSVIVIYQLTGNDLCDYMRLGLSFPGVIRLPGILLCLFVSFRVSSYLCSVPSVCVSVLCNTSIGNPKRGRSDSACVWRSVSPNLRSDCISHSFKPLCPGCTLHTLPKGKRKVSPVPKNSERNPEARTWWSICECVCELTQREFGESPSNVQIKYSKTKWGWFTFQTQENRSTIRPSWFRNRLRLVRGIFKLKD